MAPPKILVIEDDPADATLLIRGLTGIGFSTEHCYTLGGGLQRLAAGGIDLVLLDLRLPPFTGLESLVQMKAECPNVPVIVLSGYEDQVAISGAFKAGACEYFVKSALDIHRLAECIVRVIGAHPQASQKSA